MVDSEFKIITDRKANKTSQKEQINEHSIISLTEVGAHCHSNNCWIVIYDRVYDITQFLAQHPAGSEILLEHAGCDATLAFLSSGHSKSAVRTLSQFQIGKLSREERLFRNADE